MGIPSQKPVDMSKLEPWCSDAFALKHVRFFILITVSLELVWPSPETGLWLWFSKYKIFILALGFASLNIKYVLISCWFGFFLRRGKEDMLLPFSFNEEKKPEEGDEN